MQDNAVIRMGRAAGSLYRTGLLAPVAGLAVFGGSVWAMAAAAAVWPDTAVVPPGLDSCNPLRGDFGCGHGFGCACHILPPPGQEV